MSIPAAVALSALPRAALHLSKSPPGLRRLLLAATALALALAPARAQTSGSAPPALGASVGLDRVDGVLYAVGPGYRARFGAAGVELTPPLGREAPRSLPLRLALDSAQIDGRDLAVERADVEPVLEENRVVFPRGALIERYEPRLEGLEQSFVLPVLPELRGELVVRLTLDTELVARADGGGLFFAAPWDAGRGLRYGELVGIDAMGRRARGTVRLAGARLELSLPASFVEIAEAPLVLDPVLGAPSALTTGGDYVKPDIAQGSSFATMYMVVYERWWSSTDVDVYGQSLDKTGQPSGSLVLIEPTIEAIAMQPTVAGVYLAVWQQSSSLFGPWSIVCRRASSPMSAAVLLAAGGSGVNNIEPSAAQVLTNDPYGVPSIGVVWQRSGTSSPGIRFARVAIGTASTDPFTLVSTTVTTSSLDSQPAIADAEFEFVIVWQRFFSTPSPGDHDLHRAVLSLLGIYQAPPAALLTSIGPDETAPSVAARSGADYTEPNPYAVAYERRATAATAERDVRLYAFTVDGATLSAGSVATVTATSNDESDPDLAPSKAHWTVAWVQWSGGGTSIRLRSLWHDGLHLCDDPQTLSTGTPDSIQPALVNRVATFDYLGAAWTAIPAGTIGNVYARTVTYGPSASYHSFTLSAGCPPGGLALTACYPEPGAQFRHLLTGAAPNLPAFLILGFQPWYLQCGSCMLVPDPTNGVVFSAGNTSALGSASYTTPIPSAGALTGINLYEQWAVLQSPASCPAFGASLSHAWIVTFE